MTNGLIWKERRNFDVLNETRCFFLSTSCVDRSPGLLPAAAVLKSSPTLPGRHTTRAADADHKEFSQGLKIISIETVKHRFIQIQAGTVYIGIKHTRLGLSIQDGVKHIRRSMLQAPLSL